MRLAHNNLQGQLSQAGDTIVEVLIAIAIISLVLTGAYATAHKNLNATRDAQEHAQAIKLLEGQIDTMRAYSLDPGDPSSSSANADVVAGKAFCVTTADGTVHTFTLPHYDAGCQTDSGSDFTYNMSTTYNSATKSYILSAQWDSLNGNEDSVHLSYRLQ